MTDARAGEGLTLVDELDPAAAPLVVHEVSGSRSAQPGLLLGARVRQAGEPPLEHCNSRVRPTRSRRSPSLPSCSLVAGDWAEAAAIPSWRRIPQPLLWMTEARWRQSGAGAGWPLLAEACWLAPLRAGRPRGRRLGLVPRLGAG